MNEQKNKTGSPIIPLVVTGVLVCLVVILVFVLTHDRIMENIHKQNMQILDTVMPIEHDNEIDHDEKVITDTDRFGDEEIHVYRVRKNQQPKGVIFMPVPAHGYSGKISLVVGVDYDGKITGVNVLKHRETPGLGDRIDPAKSNWLERFTGQTYSADAMDQWQVVADGGKFDELSGATITSRGVLNAVRKTLEYYQANRDHLY